MISFVLVSYVECPFLFQLCLFQAKYGRVEDVHKSQSYAAGLNLPRAWADRLPPFADAQEMPAKPKPAKSEFLSLFSLRRMVFFYLICSVKFSDRLSCSQVWFLSVIYLIEIEV